MTALASSHRAENEQCLAFLKKISAGFSRTV